MRTIERPRSFRTHFGSILPTRLHFRFGMVLRPAGGLQLVRRHPQGETGNIRIAQEAATLSSDDPFVLAALGAALSMHASSDGPELCLEKALALDPNSAFAWTRSGWLGISRATRKKPSSTSNERFA